MGEPVDYWTNNPTIATYDRIASQYAAFQRREIELAVARAGFQVVESDERPLPGGTWPRIRVLAKATL
jgi:hypothetical protein